MGMVGIFCLVSQFQLNYQYASVQLSICTDPQTMNYFRFAMLCCSAREIAHYLLRPQVSMQIA